MKKQGFTLPEVLLSLAIIGVIAAITIPQVATSITKTQYGITLGRAVEQFELGIQNIIQRANDNVTNNTFHTNIMTITENDLLGNNSTNKISQALTHFKKTYLHTFFDVKLSELTNKEIDEFLMSSSTRIFKLRFYDDKSIDYSFNPLVRGAGLHIENGKLKYASFTKFPADVGCYVSADAKENCKNACAYVMFDVNGFTTKPNIYGKDIFMFNLTDSGNLIPYGDKDKCTKENPGDGTNCTARVVADGFKINYW